MIEKEKLLALYGAIGAWLHLDNADSEEIARKIARELFPPMAKPLVWDKSPNAWSCAYGYYIPTASAEALFDGVPLGYFRDVPQAKAACEAHSQAAFIEQMQQ